MGFPRVFGVDSDFIYDSFMLDANMSLWNMFQKGSNFMDVFSHPKVLSLFFGNNI